MNTPPEPLTVLCAHVIETLPDSIKEQKRLLRAVKAVLSPKHPAMKQVDERLGLIGRLEETQPALGVEFTRLLEMGTK